MTTTTQVSPLRAAITALELMEQAGLDGPWTLIRAIPGPEGEAAAELVRIGDTFTAAGVSFSREDTAVMLRLIVKCGGGVRLLFCSDRRGGGQS
jgi:hypothetical protein